MFFLVCFTFVLAGIGFLMAFSLNVFPPSIYAYVYGVVSGGSINSIYPYLSKFEGHWETTLVPQNTQTELAACEPDTGTLTIHDGQVSGTLGALSRHIKIIAVVDADGALVGQAARDKGDTGHISAKLFEQKGVGEWADAYDCRGTLVMNKIEAVSDPKQGFLVSYKGEVEFIRDGVPKTFSPGQLLYVGDVVRVSTDSQALLSIGQKPYTLTSGMSYTIHEEKQ